MPESLVFPIKNGLGASNDRFGFIVLSAIVWTIFVTGLRYLTGNIIVRAMMPKCAPACSCVKSGTQVGAGWKRWGTVVGSCEGAFAELISAGSTRQAAYPV